MSPETLLLAVVVTFLAIVTKIFGCGLAAARLGPVRALQVGVGMIPRGEVGMVVAQIGLTMGVISDKMYGSPFASVAVPAFDPVGEPTPSS